MDLLGTQRCPAAGAGWSVVREAGGDSLAGQRGAPEFRHRGQQRPLCYRRKVRDFGRRLGRGGSGFGSPPPPGRGGRCARDRAAAVLRSVASIAVGGPGTGAQRDRLTTARRRSTLSVTKGRVKVRL